MSVFTKKATEIFKPTTAAGEARGGDLEEVQLWGSEVEAATGALEGRANALEAADESNDARLLILEENFGAGYHRAETVACATTANVDIAGGGIAAGTTHDGYTVSAGERILVKAQTTASENGPYDVPSSGAASRTVDADSDAEMEGIAVKVQNGAAHANQLWHCTTTPITLGTTDLTFVVIADMDIATFDDLSDGETNKAFTTTEKSDLDRLAGSGLLDGYPDYPYALVDGQLRLAFGINRAGHAVVGTLEFLANSEEVYVGRSRAWWGVKDSSGNLGFALLTDGSFRPGKIEVINPDQVTGPGKAMQVQRHGANLYRFLADGEGSLLSYVQRNDLKTPTTAMYEAAGPLEFVPGTGESLSVGGGSPGALTTTAPYPYHAFMFDSGTRGGNTGTFDPTAVFDFVPLKEAVESTTGETPGSGMIRYLHKAEVDGSETFRTWLYNTFGMSGAKIVDIAQGTPPYSNGLAVMAKAAALATIYGRALAVRGFLFDLGVNDRAAATPAATWKTDVGTYFDDIQADFAAYLASNLSAFTFLIGQTCAATTGAGDDIQIAQYELARDRSDVVIAAPKYMLPLVDTVHLTATGYAIYGEYFGRAWRELFITGNGWTGLRPSALAKSGTTVTITFDVPSGSLQWDTTTRAAATDYGFAAADTGGTPVSISSVTITGTDEVTVELATDPGTVDIFYAYDGAGASGYSGAWGNLIDGETEASITDPSFTLANWCQTFKERVS